MPGEIERLRITSMGRKTRNVAPYYVELSGVHVGAVKPHPKSPMTISILKLHLRLTFHWCITAQVFVWLVYAEFEFSWS
jgi:hypothetical protein